MVRWFQASCFCSGLWGVKGVRQSGPPRLWCWSSSISSLALRSVKPKLWDAPPYTNSSLVGIMAGGTGIPIEDC